MQLPSTTTMNFPWFSLSPAYPYVPPLGWILKKLFLHYETRYYKTATLSFTN